MKDIAIDTLLNATGSMYKLVVLASMRAVELSDGANNLVNAKPGARPINVALQEIVEGRITYKIRDGK